MSSDLRIRRISLLWLVATALLFTPVSLFAQRTNIDAPDNDYSISDDIKLGREAATQGDDLHHHAAQWQSLLPDWGHAAGPVGGLQPNVSHHVAIVGDQCVERD